MRRVLPALSDLTSNGPTNDSSRSTVAMSRSSAVWTSGCPTSGASTTTTAGDSTPRPKWSSSSSTARLLSAALGIAAEPLLNPRFSEVTGNASAMSPAVIMIAKTAGRASTLSVIAPQIPPPLFAGLSRPMYGRRSLLILSPSTDRSAGRSVTDPTMASITTITAARAREMKMGLLVSISPVSDRTTVIPA